MRKSEKGWATRFSTYVTVNGTNMRIIFANTTTKAVALVLPANKKLTPSFCIFKAPDLESTGIDDFKVLMNAFGTYNTQIRAYRLIDEMEG